jgi:hypothetical protein
MSSDQPGICFSIRADGSRWRWKALQGDVVLGEGETQTRALAAALVIRHICRACRADDAVAMAEAA